MDNILNSFLEDAFRRVQRIAAESDVLKVVPHPSSHPPSLYLLLFENVKYLKRHPSGIVETNRGLLPVEIHFPQDYLRSIDARIYLKVATLLDPIGFVPPHPDFFHPNVDPISGAICLGNKFQPGTRIDALIYHVYDILTYQNYGVVEWDCLDPVAARYLREHPELLQALHSVPLKRRSEKFRVSVA